MQINNKPSIHPRGLNRKEAAHYIGISVTLFDQIVEAGMMPQARKIQGRKVWDIEELNKAFDELPHANENGEYTPVAGLNTDII